MILSCKLLFMPWRFRWIIFLERGLYWWEITVGSDIYLTNQIWILDRLGGSPWLVSLNSRSDILRVRRRGFQILLLEEWRWTTLQLWARMGQIYGTKYYKKDNKMTGIQSLGTCYNRVQVIRIWIIIPWQMVWWDPKTGSMCRMEVVSRTLSWGSFISSHIPVT